MKTTLFSLPGLVLLLAATAMAATPGAKSPARVELKTGDRICVIGNALAERQQYFGHFETLLQKHLADKHLSIRNLGYCGDEVRFRPRSLNFGSPDDHLSLRKADVIFAYFGFNESFAGEKGLPTFERELEEFITHTLAQKYNGVSAPRLVLFSPIPHENIGNPNLPDGSKTNPNLEMYSRAMATIAQKHGVPFVNLFGALLDRAGSQQKLTFNGIHLSEDGDRVVASVLMKELLGVDAQWDPSLEPLRREVLEKNFNNFHDYRAVNGFYIYGGRSQRDHTNPPYTDAYVLENERAKLREMAAVVDQRIWTVAAGGTVSPEPDYSKTRPLYKVPTNFTLPIEIKPAAEAIKTFTTARGYAVNLFASEEDFPELKNPVNFTFDTRGRLWVATMPSYPQYKPPTKPDDKLLIFEDTDRDGKADKMTVFADGLHLPTGFELGDGGAYVAQEPNVMFLKDTDGDGKADVRKLILHGFDSGDSHHAIGAFVWGPGGGIYMHEGTFHVTQVETPWGTQRNAHGAVYRYDPTRDRLQTFISYNFANPWGHCWDEWGQNFVADASGGANYYGTAFSARPFSYTGQDDFGPFKFVYTKQMQQFFPKRVRPTAGCEIVSSRHLPPEAQGNYLLNNVIGFQGVLQHTVREEGSGFVGKEIEPLLVSSDRNFRPTDVQVGPDGAVYIVDWFNPLVGHMQHSLRDPNRDHAHGRIWRITYPGRPLLELPKIDGASIAELLPLLKTPELRTRQQVRTRLREFPTAQVVPAVRDWVAALPTDDPKLEHHKLEALWVLQHHNAIATWPDVSRKLLVEVLHSPDYHARAAATRVLSFWHDEMDLNDALALLRVQANDSQPRVRLEAVRAASWIDSPVAAEIALDALKHPTDYYINYTLDHAVRRLQEFWQPMVASGRPFASGNPKAIEYIIGRLGTSDLVNMTRSEPVFLELLQRPGIVHQYRKEALMGLAKLHGTTMVDELLSAVERLDKLGTDQADLVLADLTHFFHTQPMQHDGGPHAGHTEVSAKALASHRDRLQQLARDAQRPIARRVAMVALIAADESADRVWNDSVKDIGALRDVVEAVPLIPDEPVRASLYDRVASLVRRLPPELEQQLQGAQGLSGRYVRIEIPGKNRVLTLAEVEVYSRGRNIAPQGKARQIAVSNNGRPERAIDGNTSGVYNDGGQTHTPSMDNPWWELDLGSEQPIEKIVIWNRTESGLGDRLKNFRVYVLDSNRQPVFTKKGNPVPKPKLELQLKGDPRSGLRNAAIKALSYIPNHDVETFRRVAPLVGRGQFRDAAIQTLGRLDRSQIPVDQVRPVVDQLLAYIESVPEKQRTRTNVMDAIQLGKDLSGLLPKAEAISIRRRLADLAVEVIVIRPIPHRMLYDREDFYVVAGKPVEIVFENTDIMPHNLVITEPGARELVGILAEKLGSSPDAFEKQFVPDSDKVMHATKMLQPGQQHRLQIKAPAQVGEYPYVCTFPGHWRTMWGTMHVVSDISEMPLHQPEPKREEGPTRQFVRKWTLADLQASQDELKSGRSFRNGKELFKAVSCAQCHRMNGEGGQVGPDLVDVRRKLDERKIDLNYVFRSLVEPSHDIDKKYRTNIVIDDEGRPYSGVVIYADEEKIRLAANPLDKKAVVSEIPVESIEERTESLVSIMPEGLLNTLTRGELLDLVAYILSGGNPNDPAFRK